MNIAVLGTGLMGGPMAIKLLEAGHSVVVYNRTSSKLTPLKKKGLISAKSPEEAIRHAEFVLLILADAAAIEDVLSFEEPEKILPEKIVIQMGTIGQEESQAFAEYVTRSGGRYLEAPVLGSIPEVEAKRLIVLTAGDSDLLAKCRPLLETFGSDIFHFGGIGKAAVVKLALNQMIAALTATFSISLALVRENGIEPQAFMEVLRNSAMYTPTFDKKLGRMLSGKFDEPNFPTRHLLKDVELFATEARNVDLSTTLLESIRDILQMTVDNGYARSDYSAMITAIIPRDKW